MPTFVKQKKHTFSHFSEHLVHQVHAVQKGRKVHTVLSLISMRGQICFFVGRSACSSEGTNKKKTFAPKSC